MRIILVQFGPKYEFFLISSMLIGLNKAYPQAHIDWIGDPQFKPLIQYNKRVNNFLDINNEFDLKTLLWTQNTDICINPSLHKKAKEFASKVNAKKSLGFLKNKTSGTGAEFAKKILTNQLTTNKHILDIYYNIANLQWSGEGYGLSYHPKTKQTKEHATLNAENIPDNILKQLDLINTFKSITTNDHFILHASLALRKHVTFQTPPLPYKIEFFGNGQMIDKE